MDGEGTERGLHQNKGGGPEAQGDQGLRWTAYHILSGKNRESMSSQKSRPRLNNQDQNSGLSSKHTINSLPDPTDSFLVKKIMKGLPRSKPSKDSRFPITFQILHELVNALPFCL